MYRIALLQNDSEMLRYSWADIRPMVNRLGYKFDSFTSENLSNFFLCLDKNLYDAIIIASNACNDKVIREALIENKCILEKFLSFGKGIFVSFQMRLADYESYGFLPNNFDLRAHNRIRLGENPTEGKFSAGKGNEKHIISNYPQKICLSEVKKKCLNNNSADGLYWTFLKPSVLENYNTIIEDPLNENRSLLICSREDYKFRIVVSSLAIDWQGLDDLWENSIRYIVEGRPNLALISKYGNATFDYRFLISGLKIKKYAFKEYILKTIDTKDIAIDIHDTYVLDPLWNQDEILSFQNLIKEKIQNNQAKILYYNVNASNIPTLTAINNFREFHVNSKNALSWIISMFPTDDKGYWEGSFWCTLDVLNALNNFGYSIDYFKVKIINEIEKHYTNGSYDGVLGATCAMFEVFSMYFEKDDNKIITTKRWILSNFKNKALFEKATAIDVLVRLNHLKLDDEKIQDFKNEIVTNLKDFNNEFKIYRYCQTLITCCFYKEAVELALKLEQFQDKRDGKWINISHTSSIVELLINLLSCTNENITLIDEMIFKGIQYLKSTYNSDKFNWENKVSATAKSLKALKSFDERIIYSPDLINYLVEIEQSKTKYYIAIDTATNFNITLLKSNSALIQKNEALVNELSYSKKSLSFTKGFSFFSIIIIIPIILFLLGWSLQLTKKGQWGSLWSIYVKSFFSDNLSYLFIICLTIISLVIVLLLFKINRLPSWLKFILKPILKIFGIDIDFNLLK